MLRLLLFVLSFTFTVHCSKTSTPEVKKNGPSGAQKQVLEEVPDHVKKVENLTIFSGKAEPEYHLTLIPKQSFGSNGEPYIGEIQGSYVDENGRIIVLNINTNYEQFIYVYNPDGTFYTQIGKQGRGPGEYGFVINVQIQNKKIIIHDAPNQRLNTYSSEDFSLKRTMLIERLSIRDHEAVKDLQFGMIKSQDNGNHLVNFFQSASNTGWRIHKYLLMDSEGKALDYDPVKLRSSFKAQGATGSDLPISYMPMPFMGSTIDGMSDEGELYTVWSHEFLIKKYDAHGKYESSFYYPIKGSEFDIDFHTENLFFDENDVRNALDIHDEEFPETNPVIDLLVVDDENRIWVALLAGPERENYEWWVLKESGELLAKLILPKNQPIYDIKGGYLYSKKVNEEAGSEYVVKYLIEFAKK